MDYPTSFSDRLLVEAAIDYSYRMSRDDIHTNPIEAVKQRLHEDFKGRYALELVENVPIKRLNQKTNKNEIIQLRYLLIKDTMAHPFEYALIFQGSSSQGGSFLSGEGDWSNNFSNAVHLEVRSYIDAKNEFEYLSKSRGYNITAAAGNSLGGGLALSLADVSDALRIVAVNPSPPQYGVPYADKRYSTIINTSTDALTRVIPVDIMRYQKEDTQRLLEILQDEEMSKTERLKQYDATLKTLDQSVKFFYGVDNIQIKRSLFYSEELFFEGSHRGMILEPRKVAIEEFRNNLMYYTTHEAKTMLEITKNLLHRHDKLSKSITSLIQEGDTKFLVDHYIEPILMPLHKNKYEDFKHFTSLADFIAFDLMSDNLIESGGSHYRAPDTFEISDSDAFISKILQDEKEIVKNYQFPLRRLQHDLEEEFQINNKETDLKKNKDFFVDSFNLAINLDVDMMDLVKNIPVPIISKLYVTREQTMKFVKSLNAELNQFFFDKEELEDTLIIDDYRAYYQQHLQSVKDALEDIEKQYLTLIDNMEVALKHDIVNIPLINKLWSRKVINKFESFNSLEIATVDESKIDPHLIRKHRERVKEIVLDFRVDKIDDLLISSESMVDTLATAISYINKELENFEVSERNSLKVISKQLNAMMDNIEIPTLLFNFLEIYQEDLVTLVLKDTVAQSIDTYYHQVQDTNDQFIIRINNLKQYIIENVKSDVQKELLKQADEIIENIDKISAFIDNSI